MKPKFKLLKSHYSFADKSKFDSSILKKELEASFKKSAREMKAKKKSK